MTKEPNGARIDPLSDRVRLALEGKIAQRDLSPAEAREFDAAVAVRIENAIAQANFHEAGLPNFARASIDSLKIATEDAE